MNSRLHFFILSLFLILAGCSGEGGSAVGRYGPDSDNQDPGDEEPDNPSDIDFLVSIPGSRLSGILADPVRGTVYVTDKRQNRLYILNLSTQSISSISVGSMPTQMDLSADNSLLFVMHSGASSVVVINLDTQSIENAISLPDVPSSIAVSSNEYLYVAYEDSEQPALEAYDVSSFPALVEHSMDDPFGLFISGRSHDRTMIYLHDQTTSSDVDQWDVSNMPPSFIQSAGIASGEPTITPLAGDVLFLISPSERWETRFPNYDGDVPLHRASDMALAGTLNVEWDVVAVAASPAGDQIAIAHQDELTNPATGAGSRHDRYAYDLHIFDALTLTESHRYSLPTYVHRNGIAYAPNGDIYLLLGKDFSSWVGIIVP